MNSLKVVLNSFENCFALEFLSLRNAEQIAPNVFQTTKVDFIEAPNLKKWLKSTQDQTKVWAPLLGLYERRKWNFWGEN